MSNNVAIAFDPKGIDVLIENILPLKTLPGNVRTSSRYLTIQASMKEVGIIEPPIIYPQKGQRGSYLMLDGHIRLDIAKNLSFKSLFCYVALDDEAFTYDHKVSYLMPIQEHFMVLKAIKNGVPEERIARALNVDPATIRQKRDLLSGICPEAVEILRERHASAGAIREMKKVKPMRQIEIAEVMISANNYTTAYAKCLVAATPRDQLFEAEKERAVKQYGLEAKDLTRIQTEMQGLEREFKLVQEEYGQNMLNLVVVVAYLRRLLDNGAVVRFLTRSEQAMLSEFQKIVAAADLKATG